MPNSQESIRSCQPFVKPYFLKHWTERQPALLQWAEQIGRSLDRDLKPNEFWKFLGSGVIVENPEPEDLSILISDIAEAVGAVDVQLDADGLFTWPRSALAPDPRPIIFLVSPDDWLYETAWDSKSQNIRARFRALFEDIQQSGQAIIIVTFCETYSLVAEELRRLHRFDRCIRWLHQTPRNIALEFIANFHGTDVLAASLMGDQERLGHLLYQYFESKKTLNALKANVRRHRERTKNPVEWTDLLRWAAFGFAEGMVRPKGEYRERLITRQAGYATVAALKPEQGFIPEYVSVEYIGLETSGRIDSLAQSQEELCGHITLADVHWKIRSLLAGRAAEDTIYGVENGSFLLSPRDLNEATRLASELIVKAGFPASWRRREQAGSNLLIPPEEWVTDLSNHYHWHIRRLLTTLYFDTRGLLERNTALFSSVRDALAKDDMVTAKDLTHLLTTTS